MPVWASAEVGSIPRQTPLEKHPALHTCQLTARTHPPQAVFSSFPSHGTPQYTADEVLWRNGVKSNRFEWKYSGVPSELQSQHSQKSPAINSALAHLFGVTQPSITVTLPAASWFHLLTAFHVLPCDWDCVGSPVPVPCPAWRTSCLVHAKKPRCTLNG